MTAIVTEARNATLQDLATLLVDQHARKIDVVAPATALRSKNGLIHVEGTEPELTDDGVTMTTGIYRPTQVFDEGVAEKLGIPLVYVRKLRNERPDLYDANVNGWLHGKSVHRAAGVEVVAEPDARSFLFRGFKSVESDESSIGVARTLLSDKYATVDHLDVITATLDGVRQSGVEVNIDSCDLTDRRMYVKISAPSVAALAPTLLADYRSPFRDPNIDAQRNHGWTIEQGRAAAQREGMGYEQGDEPVVFAGFIISNSEVGDGAFSITPRLIVRVCRNGLTINVDAMRAIHLGGKLEHGIVRWSADTQSKNLATITAKARDAVATFLDVDYVKSAIAKLEQQAGHPVSDAAKTVELVGKKLAFTQTQIDGVLDHFIRGGQMTSGGIMQAVTSFAQTLPDGDNANDLEAKGVPAMAFAASLAR